LLTGMATRARSLLQPGVTTTRDLGDLGGLAARLRDEINAARQYGPRILASTVPLTIPGGHCHFLGGEVDGEDEIRAMVRRNACRGADWMKLMASGGQFTPTGPAMWESQFSPAELCAAVDEAHRLGLPVAAHAHGTDGIAAAVAAGVDTIEHCTWFAEGFRSDPREDIATQIVARGISVCIGLGPGWRAFAERLGPERAEMMFNRLRWMKDQGIRARHRIPAAAALSRGTSCTGCARLRSEGVGRVAPAAARGWMGARPARKHRGQHRADAYRDWTAAGGRSVVVLPAPRRSPPHVSVYGG
jgi:imidazolonepropionase-like amidohydrolase